MNNNNKIAYHFVGDTLHDGRPVPVDGEWLEHAGDIKLCERGLHWSADPFDALQYAPGNILCMVEYDGETVVGGDKGVSRRRRIIKRIDAESLLREFARWAALQVIDKWNAPDIVRQYLITGDEKIREAAWDAARESASAAARAFAWYAASATAIAAASAAASAAIGYTDKDAQRARFAEMVNAAFEEIEMKKMPEDLNAGFGLPKPSIHAAAHYSAFLTRYAQKQVDPAEAKALGDAAILIEILGQEVRRLEVQYVRADLAALPELQAAQPSIIEQIAQQWDGCNFDPMGETIDIGDAIRRAGKRLQTEALSQPQAEQQGAGYAIRAEFEAWAFSRAMPIDCHPVMPEQYFSQLTEAAWDGWRAALAARQAVGQEPVRYEYRFYRVDGDWSQREGWSGWADCRKEDYERISRSPEEGREVRALYTAPPAHAAVPVDGLAEAARFAREVLSELYAKYSLKIGPFSSQAQLANVRLGAALATHRQPQGDGGAVLPGDLRWKLDNLRPSSCGTAGLSREEWDYVRGIFASPPVPFAWATHHDVPMLFLTFAEAAAYCDDDEPPIALFTAAPTAAPEVPR